MKIEQRTTKPSTRIIIRFTREELIEVLLAHVAATGQSIPEGRVHVWGLEHREHDEHVALCIDSEGSQPEQPQ